MVATFWFSTVSLRREESLAAKPGMDSDRADVVAV